MKIIKLISTVIIILINGGWILFRISTIYIPVGTVGVCTQEYSLFDKKGVIQQDFGPGWHRNLGAIDSWTLFDSTVQTLEMTRDTKCLGRKGRDDVQVQSADGYAVSVNVTVKYKIREGKAHKLYEDTGSGDKYQAIVCNEAEKSCMWLFGQMKAEDFYNPHVRMNKEKEVKRLLAESLADNFVEVIDVLILNVQFDNEYENKIRGKKLAEQEVELNKSIARAEEMRGKTQLIEVETEKKITIIKQEKEAELIRMEAETGKAIAEIIAEAQKYHTKKKADADLMAALWEAEGQLLVKKAEAEGKRLCNHAMQENGRSKIIALEAAKNKSVANEFKLAIKMPKEALEFTPYFAEAQYNIGVAHDSSNQPEKSIEVYNKAIKLMPNDAKLHSNSGLYEMKIGHYGEAEKKLNMAIQRDPLLTDAYHNPGYLAEPEGDPQLSASCYEKDIPIEKTHKLADRNSKKVSIKKEKKIKKPLVSKGIPAPIQSPLSIGADLRINFGKGVEFDNADNTIYSKDFLGHLYYSLPNERGNVFISLGLTSKGFDKTVIGPLDTQGNNTLVEFQDDIGSRGPAFGGGINVSLFTLKDLKLRFDSEISLLTGKNELSEEAEYNWLQYSIEAKANYHSFTPTIPYAGICFTKLDGEFKLHEGNLKHDQANPIGLFLGAKYQYNSRVNFDTRIELIDEMSLLFSLKYAI